MGIKRTEVDNRTVAAPVVEHVVDAGRGGSVVVGSFSQPAPKPESPEASDAELELFLSALADAEHAGARLLASMERNRDLLQACTAEVRETRAVLQASNRAAAENPFAGVSFADAVSIFAERRA